MQSERENLAKIQLKSPDTGASRLLNRVAFRLKLCSGLLLLFSVTRDTARYTRQSAGKIEKYDACLRTYHSNLHMTSTMPCDYLINLVLCLVSIFRLSTLSASKAAIVRWSKKTFSFASSRRCRAEIFRFHAPKKKASASR